MGRQFSAAARDCLASREEVERAASGRPDGSVHWAPIPARGLTLGRPLANLVLLWAPILALSSSLGRASLEEPIGKQLDGLGRPEARAKFIAPLGRG